MGHSPDRTAYIIRRQKAGGGAEGAAARLAEYLSTNWSVRHLSAGEQHNARRLPGLHGPGWWRAMRFARGVDAALANRAGVRLSLERGPDCDIYRAGDGVHGHWRKLRHGSSPAWMFNPLHWLYPRLEAKTVNSARFVAANSNLVQDQLRAWYPHCAHKLRLVRSGFDPDRFFPNSSAKSRLCARMGLPESCELFLFVGSGWQRKGLARAVEIVAACNQARASDHPGAILLVAGKGRPGQFAAQVTRLGMSRKVHFLGLRGDVQSLYQAADIFVLPTLYDPFANVCLEALACGTPVLTTPGNGAAEILDHGRTGFILADNFAQAVAWCRSPRPSRAEVAQSVAHLTVAQEMSAFSGLMEQCLSASGRAEGRGQRTEDRGQRTGNNG